MQKRKKTTLSKLYIITFLFFAANLLAKAQIPSGVYMDTVTNNGSKQIHQVKIHNGYFIYNEYEIEPANFIKTLGGFTEVQHSGSKNELVVRLEFNSDYEKDSVKIVSIPFKMDGKNLQLNWFRNLTLKPIISTAQDLDGAYLFATRGPDKGQERRGEESSRKTLKLLMDNTFQWVAYDTNSFRFSGTGGGSYSAKDGIYKENIAFFSKDNSRVGAQLEFKYELEGADWHHTGNNSKGEPMYEIWSQRPSNSNKSSN
jgi:hypothetical protein